MLQGRLKDDNIEVRLICVQYLAALSVCCCLSKRELNLKSTRLVAVASCNNNCWTNNLECTSARRILLLRNIVAFEFSG